MKTVSKRDHLDPIGKSNPDVLVFQLHAAKEKMNQKRQYKYDMNEVDLNQMRQLFNDVICESMTPMLADQFWNCL